MRYFTKFNADGRRETGFPLDGYPYTSEFVDGVEVFTPPIPHGFIEISEEEHIKYCENGGNEYIRGADSKPQKKPPYVPTLAESKQAKLTELYLSFCTVRDALTWVQTDSYRYGYDRKTDDIANFLATWKRIETKIKNNEADQTVPYKVWTSATTKELIPHSLEMMEVCLAQSEQEQKAAYITLKDKQIEVESATTKEELDQIFWTE